jgi:recombination protein RecT
MSVAPTEPTNGTTAIATVATKQMAKKPIDTFRDLLDKLKPQLQMALPKHVDVGRMIRICVTTLQRNPDLLACTQESVLGCLFQCAQLGLEPDGLLGHAYLIPFNDKKNNRKICTLIVGYKGLLKLARQSNEIASISARVVYSKDEFEYEFGLEDKLTHKPTHDEDPGEMTYAYAIFRYKGGGYHFDVMSKVEIDAIRARSKSGQSGPWVTDYDEMAKKTVLRRASKMAPASIEDLSRAIALDSRSEAGIAPSLDIDMPPPPAADVPGVEAQGRRLTLGKKATIDVPSTEAQAEQTPASPTNVTAAKAEPAKEFIMSTSKERGDIARMATEAHLSISDVCGWVGKKTTTELSHDEVEAIKAKIMKVTGEVDSERGDEPTAEEMSREPGSEG